MKVTGKSRNRAVWFCWTGFRFVRHFAGSFLLEVSPTVVRPIQILVLIEDQRDPRRFRSVRILQRSCRVQLAFGDLEQNRSVSQSDRYTADRTVAEILHVVGERLELRVFGISIVIGCYRFRWY